MMQLQHVVIPLKKEIYAFYYLKRMYSSFRWNYIQTLSQLFTVRSYIIRLSKNPTKLAAELFSSE